MRRRFSGWFIGIYHDAKMNRRAQPPSSSYADARARWRFLIKQPRPALNCWSATPLSASNLGSAAPALMYDAEPVGPCETAIGECPPPAAAHGTDRCIFHRAGTLRLGPAALTVVKDAEAVGTRQAGIGEGARTIGALPAYRRVFEAAHLRARGTGARTRRRGDASRQEP